MQKLYVLQDGILGDVEYVFKSVSYAMFADHLEGRQIHMLD